MSKRLLVVLVAGCLVWLARVALTAEPLEVASPSAAVVFMTGTVQVAPPGSKDFGACSPDQVLTSGWSIRTGPKSAADLLLWDKSMVRLHDNTTIKIVDLSENETDQTFVRKLELSAGRMWADVTKGSDKNTFEVKGPQAVAAVKGTSFMVEAVEGDEVGTDIQVWEGFVDCTPLVDIDAVERITVDQEFVAAAKEKAAVRRFDRAQLGLDDPWLKRNWESREKMKAYLASLPHGPRGTINLKNMDPAAKLWMAKHFRQFPPTFQRKVRRLKAVQQLRKPGVPGPGLPGHPGGPLRPIKKPTVRPLNPR